MNDHEKYRFGKRVLAHIEHIRPSMRMLTGSAVYVNGFGMTVRIEHQHPITNTLHVAQKTFSEYDIDAIDRIGLLRDEAAELWEKLFLQSQKDLTSESEASSRKGR